jgi:hypothetical protein
VSFWGFPKLRSDKLVLVVQDRQPIWGASCQEHVVGRVVNMMVYSKPPQAPAKPPPVFTKSRAAAAGIARAVSAFLWPGGNTGKQSPGPIWMRFGVSRCSSSVFFLPLLSS